MNMPSSVLVESALQAFIDTIEETGGVTLNEAESVYVPVHNPQWMDLGLAYMDACKILGATPMIK